MPKAFLDHEKDVIRSQLRAKGEKLFEKQGLRKTTVDELARAAGISKGAFYLFFESKEELYLEILEQIETEVQTSILEFTIHPQADAHESVRDMLKVFFLTRDAFPLLKRFGKSDFDYLVRKIPPERVQQHANKDEDFTVQFIQKIEREGITVTTSPRGIGNLIKSLFFVGLRRDDFGEHAYEELMDVLIDLVAGYVAGEYDGLRN